MILDITKLKCGNIISYDRNEFLFHLEDPKTTVTFESLFKKRMVVPPDSKFLILNVEKLKHHSIKDLYLIKLLVDNQIVWGRVTQSDVYTFGFYLVN